MTEFSKNVVKKKSKYIKEPREKSIFYGCSVLYIFALYILPSYLGIQTPVFDLTALRIMMIVLGVLIFADHERAKDFLEMIKHEKISFVLFLYTFVLVYTMVLRADFNAFFNPFMELVQLYLLLYAIRYSVGVNKTIRILIGFIYLLVILGFVEAAIQVSPFLIFNTIHKATLYSGAFIRSGSYRIMSNGGHSLGYGLLLITALPFAGIDLERNEYNIFRRPLLLAGTIGNIFLTGSRSTLGIMMVELAMMFILTDKKFLKFNIIFLVLFIIAFAVIVLCTQSTSFGRYVMLQITSLIDTVFGTNFSIKYGADLSGLLSSSSYRNLLWKVFGISWLNPILGRGKNATFTTMIDGEFIGSIDNFYVVEYISYAYPGLITFSIFFLIMLGLMIKSIFKTKSAVARMLFIGTVGYYVHLSIADALMTLKYVYILFAIMLCLDEHNEPSIIDGRYLGKRRSVYVRG
jgi:hypothetical protein